MQKKEDMLEAEMRISKQIEAKKYLWLSTPTGPPGFRLIFAYMRPDPVSASFSWTIFINIVNRK